MLQVVTCEYPPGPACPPDYFLLFFHASFLFFSFGPPDDFLLFFHAYLLLFLSGMPACRGYVFFSSPGPACPPRRITSYFSFTHICFFSYLACCNHVMLLLLDLPARQSTSYYSFMHICYFSYLACRHAAAMYSRFSWNCLFSNIFPIFLILHASMPRPCILLCSCQPTCRTTSLHISLRF